MFCTHQYFTNETVSFNKKTCMMFNCKVISSHYNCIIITLKLAT